MGPNHSSLFSLVVQLINLLCMFLLHLWCPLFFNPTISCTISLMLLTFLSNEVACMLNVTFPSTVPCFKASPRCDKTNLGLFI